MFYCSVLDEAHKCLKVCFSQSDRWLLIYATGKAKSGCLKNSTLFVLQCCQKSYKS